MCARGQGGRICVQACEKWLVKTFYAPLQLSCTTQPPLHFGVYRVRRGIQGLGNTGELTGLSMDTFNEHLGLGRREKGEKRERKGQPERGVLWATLSDMTRCGYSATAGSLISLQHQIQSAIASCMPDALMP